MQIQISKTKDGSATFYVPELNEHYHSTNGAITESEYVFLEKGFNFHSLQPNLTIIEIGFGTGLNCWLTALSAYQQKRKTIYFAYENYPVPSVLISQLNYTQQKPDINKYFEKIHACEWEQKVKIHEYFYLTKIKADITSPQFQFSRKADLIYFDAFGPDKQPEMWSKKIFQSISDFANENAVFVTYSAKGEVRRNLTAVGFTMERLPGPPGKNQMLRGIKNNSSL